jgi:hypothetical protein
MKQLRQRASAAKPASTQRSASVKAAGPVSKDWSIKVEVRLPHKIGLPLGSSASDGSQ